MREYGEERNFYLGGEIASLVKKRSQSSSARPSERRIMKRIGVKTVTVVV